MKAVNMDYLPNHQSKPYTYFDRGKIYYSDTCLPLNEAWKDEKIRLEAWARPPYPGSVALPDDVLAGLSTIGFWDATLGQDWGLDWHRNEGIEITFLETGGLSFAVDNKIHQLIADELTITRPWQVHKLGSPNIGVGRLYWIILDVNVRHPHQEWIWPHWLMLTKPDMEELTRMLRQNEQPVWKANLEIRKCFQRIGQLVMSGDVASNESWMIISINELLLHLLKFFREGEVTFDENLTKQTRTVSLFIDHLENTFAEPWTLEMMAEQCSLGVTRFVHYFKQIKNQPPMHYLTALRLNAASYHLKNHMEMPIHQIGYECGFTSGQYFSTVFKQKFGCSPQAYRNQFKEQ
ncbi:helix-turn-helix transcriptional regulator [Parapedobacter koreensis]|uniref:AraC family transcriptional regulator, L-rhamnose operon regulatory protein RhaS n=1 Tax=Parapedobacter koreensis TaxID=332977 RepID=A0A1H7QMX8_9SPHI|nr:AraC family transcriptional regulator [Parapedobacter koreensis]SEL48984.1 AraC family transcriptional regulator, L-rhamnose operon regulatory protein RhaS [Parapedobacter koreensis]